MRRATGPPSGTYVSEESRSGLERSEALGASRWLNVRDRLPYAGKGRRTMGTDLKLIRMRRHTHARQEPALSGLRIRGVRL